MARINNVDQILVLLQAHLERLEHQKKTGATPRTRAARNLRTAQTPLERVQALAATEAMSEDDLSRALIGALLAQEFGTELAADLAFQQMVEQVARTVAADPEAAALTRRAIAQLVGG